MEALKSDRVLNGYSLKVSFELLDTSVEVRIYGRLSDVSKCGSKRSRAAKELN